MFKGNSSEYACKMHISRSAFFRLLHYIKAELEAPVFYCKTDRYYKYYKNGVMFFGFLPSEVLTPEGMKKIQGGARPY